MKKTVSVVGCARLLTMLRAALAVTSRIVRRQRSVLFVNRSAQRRCVGTLRGGSTPITVADTVDGTEGIYPTRETDHTDDGDEGDNSGEHSVDLSLIHI